MLTSRVLVDVSPLRESRDFRLLWIAQLLTWTGRQMVVVAVPYQIYVLTNSSLAVGLVGLVEAVPIVIAGLYGGALADRFDRRRVQVVAKCLVAAGSASLAAAGLTAREPVVFIYGVVAVMAAAWTIDQTARAATIPRLVSRRLLPAALSLGQTTFQTAAVAGPTIAGVVIAKGGVSWAYGLDAITFIPVVALLWLLSPQPAALNHGVELGWRAPAEGLRYMRRSRLIMGLFASDLIAMIFGMPTAVFPALALSVFRIGPAGLGLLYAALGTGAVLASVLSGWVRHVKRQATAIVIAIAVWGLAVAYFGFAGRQLWIGLPLLAIAGAANNISAVFRHTILQLTIPDSIRGRISALNLIVAYAGPRLGDLEAGVAASLVSPVFSIVSGGLAATIGILVLAILVPEMRTQRAKYDDVLLTPPATEHS
jgi:MFS family permease